MKKIGNMMNTMKQAKNAYSKMKTSQKILEKKRVEVEHEGIKVIMNGKQEIVALKFSDELMQMKRTKAEGMVLKALNMANKEIQKIIQAEAKNMTGGMDPAEIMKLFK
ncbi:YbaB/EbfC family nucleoid-associated protein [bacterium]